MTLNELVVEVVVEEPSEVADEHLEEDWWGGKRWVLFPPKPEQDPEEG